MQPSNEGKSAGHKARRLSAVQLLRELRLRPGFQSHEQLWDVVKKLPTDFKPWGKRENGGDDCSCNCRWFHLLAGTRGEDWGVCANPQSPRAGLLTFEHMGCRLYEWDTRLDYLQTERGKRALSRYEAAENVLRGSIGSAIAGDIANGQKRES
jgi:hypothetical protein